MIVGFLLVLMTILLAFEIYAGHVGTFEVVGEIVLIVILLLLWRASRRLKRGVGIEVLEDVSSEGRRLVNASDFEVGTALTGTLYLSLSVIVKTDGERQWFIRLRTVGGKIGEIRDGAELLFKNADGEMIEICNSAGLDTVSRDVGLFDKVIERKGVYYINLEILDALCSWEFVKIRVVNELRPLDVDVKGQNLANLFTISRNVIEKALDPSNTIYSGM